MEIIKLLAQYAGYGMTILGFLMAIFKPLRTAVIDFLTKQKNDSRQDEQLSNIMLNIQEIQKTLENQKTQNELLQEALRSTIRNDITHMYYIYKERGTIPILEKENLAFLYAAYEKLHGNSYVKQCYKELMNLPTEQ